MINPTIVAITYNRATSLSRLLESLSNSDYSDCGEVNLIISIDFSGQDEVALVAEKFQWPFGDKTIIKHKENLGLRKHVLTCGDLTVKYGAVIILEDDLLVSPAFYQFAKRALDFYKSNPKVGGISLYHYQHNESTELPFEIICNGYDAYFMQVPSSWGQLWTKEQWSKFRIWHDTGQVIDDKDFLPDNVKAWPESSWKKYFWKYLVHEQLYFVYPSISYTTNTGAVGAHHDEITALHQSSLSLKMKDYRFPNFDETLNIYDSFFEITSPKFDWLKSLKLQHIEMDIYGSKKLKVIKSPFLLSSKQCNNPIASYNIEFFPINLNLYLGLQPSEEDEAHLYLGKLEDFEESVNNNFMQLLVNRVDLKLLNAIKAAQYQRIVSTPEFKLGYRILHFWALFRAKIFGNKV